MKRRPADSRRRPDKSVWPSRLASTETRAAVTMTVAALMLSATGVDRMKQSSRPEMTGTTKASPTSPSPSRGFSGGCIDSICAALSSDMIRPFGFLSDDTHRTKDATDMLTSDSGPVQLLISRVNSFGPDAANVGSYPIGGFLRLDSVLDQSFRDPHFGLTVVAGLSGDAVVRDASQDVARGRMATTDSCRHDWDRMSSRPVLSVRCPCSDFVRWSEQSR